MVLKPLTDSVIVGDAKQAKALTEAALSEGLGAPIIVTEGLIPAMGVVGHRFGCGEIYVPEMLLAARAMQTALSVLEPLMSASEMASRGTVVIGTVKGDVHDIGKNIVSIMLKGSGFVVHDLGADVAPERFVEAVREYRPDIVGLSALLTTTMPAMATVLEALEASNLRGEVRVMVGGAPVTEDYALSIGADAYERDAGSAAERAVRLLSSPDEGAQSV